MIFYFNDKNDFEKRIIDDVLCEHNIKHKIITNHIPYETNENEEFFEEIYILSYDIQVNTSLEMFDYLKWLVDKRIIQVVKLNKCLKKRMKKKKDEIDISK